MPERRFQFAVSPVWLALSALWLGCAPPTTNGAPSGPNVAPPIVFDDNAGVTKDDENDEATKASIPGLLVPSGATSPGENTGETSPGDAPTDIAADSAALLVTDPEALSGLTLKNVLYNLDWNADNHIGILQRMFDTFNTSDGAIHEGAIHCDAESNPAFQNSPPTACPRPEGSLATSMGFFTPDDPDHFYPVAAVNRFDLRNEAPIGNTNSTCGEHRIIFAKESGKTDPNDRVFLIFEARVPLPDPGEGGCAAVAKLWRDVGLAKDPAEQGALLTKFYLYGLPGLEPVLSRKNLGEQLSVGGYHNTASGRIRISAHAGADWELRELRADALPDGSVAFVPSLVGNTPAPHLFEPLAANNPSLGFIPHFLSQQLPLLSATKIEEISTTVAAGHLAGDSPAGGPQIADLAAIGANNYLFVTSIQNQLDALGLSTDCPPDDPLTAKAILRRATSQTCAGCHAPNVLLGPERKLGCGLVWPDALDGVHIDEHGQRSPALEQVFLPQRAADLAAYLKDLAASESGAP